MHCTLSLPSHFRHDGPSRSLLELCSPVVDQGRRARHHCAGDEGVVPGRLREESEDQANCCEGLAKPHLVCENAAIPVEVG